jgi:hypothetical protein
LTDCDPSEAAAAITDGFNDQGIDAIYFDENERVVYIVQSKWSHGGNSTVDLGELAKFLKGVEHLILPDFTGFNDKIKNREAELKSNLLFRSDVRVVLVLAYSSPSPLGSHVSAEIETFLASQNNVGDADVFGSETFDLKRLYGRLTGGTDGKISLQISLRDWGTIDTPYRAYYGRIPITEIASWAKHGRPLFDKNLRYFRPATDVNEAIGSTLENSPTNFWYFNNGITILCKTLDKAVIGADKHDIGLFDCTGVSIVNGAQTVGVIWELARRNEACVNGLTAWIQARMISLKDCPDGFGTAVTRAANTQNPIRHRDFAALDPEQHRLAQEMLLDQKRYAFKSGDLDPKSEDGCNIEDATVALACSNADITLAVQAKREVGQLWQDITKPPYTILFNKGLSAPTMWRAVLIMRTVEKMLGAAYKETLPRGELVAVHGNRFVLHRVFTDTVVRTYRDPATKEEDIIAAAQDSTRKILVELAELINRVYPKDYLANLFKNSQKNRDLDTLMSNPKAEREPPKNLELFSNGE